jgi:hypothetical protein
MSQARDRIKGFFVADPNPCRGPQCALCQNPRRWAVFPVDQAWYCTDCYRDLVNRTPAFHHNARTVE